MSTARPRSALACFCTSAALALAGSATAAEPDPLRAAERALAAERGLYLLVVPEPPALEIKARGLTLDRLPLGGVAVLVRRQARGPRPEPAALPAVWRVAEEAEAARRRRLIAPAELKPPPEEGMESVTAAAAAGEEEPLPEPPAEYRIGFEGGWELWVGPALPRAGWAARFASAVAAGWRALWRLGSEPPPGAIALAADPATARRLHHLFRGGTPVLVAAPPPD